MASSGTSQAGCQNFRQKQPDCRTHVKNVGLAVETTMKTSENDNEKEDISTAISNSRSHSSQNEQDFSTQTAEQNNSNKTTQSHILMPVKSLKDPSGMERKYYGVSSPKLKEKVVILLGVSGSGKTTLVNFIANYFQGVKAADDALFCVDVNSSNAQTCTTVITAYTFCIDENDAPITVIDTPGLNKSSRTDVEDNIQSLKTFLTNAASNNLDIHAIGLVVEAHSVLIASSERLIINYISSLFGQSVADHLIIFVTNADNQEIPPVVEAMKNCNIKSKAFFKFNNSTLTHIIQENDDFDRVYWRMGCRSWRKFSKILLELPQLSVNSFKVTQSKVYLAKVIESAGRDLKDELKIFVNYCKDSKYMTKESFEKCEQVWKLAAVFNYLRCTEESGVSDVMSIAETFTNEVCNENNFSSKECNELLFLGRSKGVLGAGMGVVRSMGPLYERALRFLKSKEKEKKIPSMLHCCQCKADHGIERYENDGRTRLYFGSDKNKTFITYICKECKCKENLHEEASDQKSAPSFDLFPEHVLQNTRKVLDKILREKSPAHIISLEKYIHLVNIALDFEFDMFINNLLKI